MWATVSEIAVLLQPNSTVSIENSVTSDVRNFYFVSNLTIEHTNTISEVISRSCFATVTVNGIETNSSSSIIARVTVNGKPVCILICTILHLKIIIYILIHGRKYLAIYTVENPDKFKQKGIQKTKFQDA